MRFVSSKVDKNLLNVQVQVTDFVLTDYTNPSRKRENKG